MSLPQVAILDYGMGNLRSVEKALERAGAGALRTSDPQRARSCDGLVLPGVGAFPEAMRRIRALGLDVVATEQAAAGVPLLGICLGMQLLFERSSEREGGAGLGLMPGEVVPLEAPGLKVPHMGWEPVRWERASELVEGVPTGTPFYFVHSLTVRPGRPEDVLGTAEHGGRFACAVARPPVFGLQFHPEKSSAAGLRLLGNFAGICATATASA